MMRRRDRYPIYQRTGAGRTYGRSPECVRFFEPTKRHPYDLHVNTTDNRRNRLRRQPARHARATAFTPRLTERVVFPTAMLRVSLGARALRVSLMILPQVHLRKPCYDFYFL